MNQRIAFIGGGNMANSIVGGLVAQGFEPENIQICDPIPETRSRLEESFGVMSTDDNAAAAAAAGTVILAVKPQIMAEVCKELRPGLSHKPLIISIAAGIPLARLGAWLGDDLPIVRSMPNTPALVQAGASGLYANEHCSSEHRALAETILRSVGIVEWLADEDLIDAVTAVSGSGPAYFFLFMEAMIDAAVAQGLPREAAANLAIQTCLGAGQLAKSSEVDVAELRRRVSSPGGTTLKAIESFEKSNLRAMVSDAMQACAHRAKEMADEL